MKKLFPVICVLASLRLCAQQPDLVFHHLTVKDGLSYNIVNCFLKDSRGLLWIGTYNGLNRYDGAHFYVFRKERNKNSLPNNTVHKLAEDKSGNIWGATDEGVFCYDQGKNKFKNYHTPGEQDWPGITNMLCDKDGVIWASNRTGLIRYNAKADSFETAPLADSSAYPGNDAWVNKNGMAETPDSKGIWLACSVGMLYYDKVLKKFTSYKNNSDTVLFASKSASALCATTYGHYWYADNKKKRLVGFDAVTKKIKYIVQPKEFEKLHYVATVFEDNNHVLWISTWGYEIMAIDYLHGNKVQKVSHNKNDRLSIAGDFFWTAMQENDGTLWIGTVGGISRCNTNHSFYKVHHFADSLFRKPSPAIEFVSEDKNDSSWWVTTTRRWLLHYDPATAKIISYDFYKMPVNKAGFYPEHTNKMLFFKDRILMFTNHGPWVKEGAGSFKPFIIPALPDSISLTDAVMMNDSLMYCTDFYRLFIYNLRSKQVTPLQYKTGFTLKDNVQILMVYLTKGANDTLWLINGPDYMSYAKGNDLVAVKFASSEKDGSNGFYAAMTADKTGNLWIAKKGDGLFFYNPAEKKYQQWRQYDGLVMDHTMAVSVDSSNKVWTASYNQFSVYNPLLNSFYNFSLPLSENNYTYTNFMTTLANGNIICNVADELVEFFPGRLKAYSVNTEPIISTLSVGSNEKLLPGNNKISLAPDENSLLVKFGLLADYEASPYDMLYILEGAEKTWIVAGNNFEASYNSLPPGNYTFRVKALAKDKSWQTKETVLQVHIATPFYKSWWFITLLCTAFIAAVYFMYRYRLHQQQQVIELKSKTQLLEKEKAIVLYESLKQQLNPHFLFNSLTSLSGLIETDQKLAGRFLEQMSKLYRYILKSSDNETVPLKDEIAFVKLFIGLQKTRFKDGLEVNINVPDEYLHHKIAPVTLQNMVENAIKHNIIDAASPLVINMFVEDEYLVIKNNLQKKNVVETSNKQGLENLRSLYGYLTGRPVIVEEDEKYFSIKIPLV